MSEEFHVHGAYDHTLEYAAESSCVDSFAGRTTAMAAILSTAGAISGYQGGATQNAALLAKNEVTIRKAKAANRWACYQAKNQKRAIAGLTAQLSDTDQTAVRCEAQCYAVKKGDIRRQAEDQERLVKEADDASELVMHHYHRWVQAMVAIQVSIALTVITSLSRRRWTQALSHDIAVVGGVMATLALFHI